MKGAGIGGLLAVVLALGGCDAVYSHDHDFADVENRPPAAAPPLGPQVQAPPPVATPVETADAANPIVQSEPGTVRVAAGQSVYRIARAHQIPPRALIDANHLEAPYDLEIGQTIIVPAVRSTRVAPGETIEALAHRTGSDPMELARANHLTSPYALHTGQALVLPDRANPPVQAAAAAPQIQSQTPQARITGTALPPPAPAPVAKPADDEPRYLSFNDAPAGPVSPPASPPVPVHAAPPATVPAAPPPMPAPVALATPVAVARGPVLADASTAAAIAAHRPPVDPIFTWPAHGTVIGLYGVAANGSGNAGINIAAPAGSAVVAADDGVVAYAGNEVRGYGNLVLIRHSNGWVSAYAHNDSFLVAKGDQVRRGQQIATVGATGGVSRPQLHFELRDGTKPSDPLDHLPAPGPASG